MKQDEPDILDAWFDAVLRNHLIDLHTALPAVVESFDASTQTAKVNISINKVLNDGTTFAIAPVLNVPVLYPSGGGFSVTFPVSSGDECLVIFSERAIDKWLQYGGNQDPSDNRIHAYNDAFAVLGGKSNPNAIDSYSTNSLQIRNNSGTTYINVTDTEIKLEINGGGAVFSSDGSVIFANGASINALGQFVSASSVNSDLHTHSGVATGSGSTGVAQ